MHFSTVLAVVPAFVLGQTNTTGNGVVHNITVGGGGTPNYSPTNITAAVGDTVSFIFVAGNHTATQSTFPAPCTQEFNATTNVTGISSGFMFIQANTTSFPEWSIVVQDTTPLWFFCLQANHCQKGMVFSINANPNSNKSYADFQLAAMGTNASIAAPTTNGSATPPTNGSTTNSGTPSSSGSTSQTGTSSSSATSATHTSAGESFIFGRSAGGLVTLVAFAVGLTLF